MDDPHLLATRKRPRLDSGRHSSDSIAMSSPNPENSGDKQQTLSDLDNEPQSSSSAVAAATASSTSPSAPASKVTINVRSPSLADKHLSSPTAPPDVAPHAATTNTIMSQIDGPAPSPPPAAAAAANGHRVVSPVPDTSLVDTTAAAAAAGQHASASGASSPAQSVDIEVAEVEDMDQDPSKSSWRSLKDATHEPRRDFSLAEEFPRVVESFELREMVEEVAQVIEKGACLAVCWAMTPPAATAVVICHRLTFFRPYPG